MKVGYFFYQGINHSWHVVSAQFAIAPPLEFAPEGRARTLRTKAHCHKPRNARKDTARVRATFRGISLVCITNLNVKAGDLHPRPHDSRKHVVHSYVNHIHSFSGKIHAVMWVALKNEKGRGDGRRWCCSIPPLSLNGVEWISCWTSRRLEGDEFGPCNWMMSASINQHCRPNSDTNPAHPRVCLPLPHNSILNSKQFHNSKANECKTTLSWHMNLIFAIITIVSCWWESVVLCHAIFCPLSVSTFLLLNFVP